MGKGWLVLAVVLSLAVIAMPVVEAKRPQKLEELTPFQIAALGDIPTCCPTNPLQYCDFYFDAHRYKLPKFHLQDNISGDHPLSPVSPSKLHWKGWLGHFSPSLLDSKSGKLAYVGSTWKNGTFLQCKRLPSYVNTGNQFFMAAVGDGHTDKDASKLHARTFQRAAKHQHGMKFFFNRCILLPLTNMVVSTPKGDVNLWEGDGNAEYPEKRRCVVFQTTR